jgi:hypothetical protein
VDDLPRDDLLGATPEIAARLAGVTVRQVNYWREIDLGHQMVHELVPADACHEHEHSSHA